MDQPAEWNPASYLFDSAVCWTAARERVSMLERFATQGVLISLNLPELFRISPVIHRVLAAPSRHGGDTTGEPRSLNPGIFSLEGGGMRGVWILTGVLAAASVPWCAQAAAQEDAGKLVRETVYNELHDHVRHGYWRYWVKQHGQDGSRIEEQVETEDGPVGRVLLRNGQRLDAQDDQVEEAKLRALMSSRGEQANLRQSHREDEERVGRILALLPDGFVYKDVGMENGCRHLRYTPNPKYTAHTIDARVFHRLSGDLWVDVRMKRMKRLEGHLDENVDFGLGMLGRVNKGSWFRMERTQVSADEWKMARLEVHMNGRALMFKNVAHDTSEVRGGFEAVPPRMNLEQGMQVLRRSVAEQEAALAAGRVSPVALVRGGQWLGSRE
jgi:hypothetical protein